MRTVLYSLAGLLLLCCKGSPIQMPEEKPDPLAHIFHSIEQRLQEFSKRHNGKLSTVRSRVQGSDSKESDSIFTRHIVWNEGGLGKAILISQHSGEEGIDTTAWDFSNVAWLQDTLGAAKPTYVKFLARKVPFDSIEKNIMQLLSVSEKNLGEIKMDELK